MIAGVWLNLILSMGIAASLTAVALIAVRLAVGKLFPKYVMSVLWLVVVFQMLSPVSISSSFSLDKVIPVRQTLVERAAETVSRAAGETVAQPGAQEYENLLAEIEEASVDGWQAAGQGTVASPRAWWSLNGTFLLVGLWTAGAAVVLGRSFTLSRKLTKRCETAVLFQDKELLQECVRMTGINRPAPVYVTEQAESPFVTGLIKPRILIPASLLKEDREQVKWVILHEFCHITRGDHIVKFLAFVGTAIHWINPVLWASFFLLERDMEMACDEKVLTLVHGSSGDERALNRKSYASSLLRMAVEGEGYASGALNFAESNISRRIKNIALFKKPKQSVKIASAVIAAVLILLLLPQYGSGGRVFSLGGFDLGSALGILGRDQLPGSILVMGKTRETAAVDTVMILNQSDDGSIYLAQIPRDTFLPEEEQKLSLYAAQHDPETVLQYLSDSWGIQLDYYIVVELAMIEDLVDAAGGVEYTIPWDLTYHDPYDVPPLEIELKAGRQMLSGETAGHLLRFRMGYERGDLDRINVQRQLMEEVISQRDRLASGLSAKGVVEILQNHEVKTNMSLAQLTGAAGKLYSSADTIAFAEIPYNATEAPPYYVVLDREGISEAFGQMGL